jgi:hypothetical protein
MGGRKNRLVPTKLCAYFVIPLITLLDASVSTDAIASNSYVNAPDSTVAFSCSSSGLVVELAVGWSMKKAKAFTSTNARANYLGSREESSIYINRSSLFRNAGMIPVEIKCPEMVVVSGKTGLISSIEVYSNVAESLDLNQAMNLAEFWRSEFSAAGLTDLSSEPSEHVVSLSQARSFFRVPSSSAVLTEGQVLGAWHKNKDKVTLAVERWNTSQSTALPPKFVYVLEIMFSTYP